MILTFHLQCLQRLEGSPCVKLWRGPVMRGFLCRVVCEREAVTVFIRVKI